jgi:hypothetical protein
MLTTQEYTTMRPATLTIIAGLALISVAGCGDDGLPRRYSVSGTVTYLGKPVESGTITFHPIGQKGHSAGGTIAAGNFTLSSVANDDGAVPGQYKVTVASLKQSVGGGDPKLKLMYEKAQATGGVPIPPQVKKQLKTEHLVPAKYERPETSDLTADVQAHSNVFPFELKD